MLKKIFLVLGLCLILSLPASAQSYEWRQACIGTSIATIAASGTATNGSEFTAIPILVSRPLGSSVVAITITFTGDGSMSGADIDFYFQASYDGGTTYSTDEFVIVDIGSNAASATNVVRHTELVNVYGISHLRLWKVVNNDSSNTITTVNATISGGR